jgi:hypothetical protein
MGGGGVLPKRNSLNTDVMWSDQSSLRVLCWPCMEVHRNELLITSAPVDIKNFSFLFIKLTCGSDMKARWEGKCDPRPKTGYHRSTHFFGEKSLF